MKVKSIIPWTLALLASGGPLPEGECPQTRCYNTTNECGMVYGGCWDECAPPASRLQYFTKPICPLTSFAPMPTTPQARIGTPLPPTTSIPCHLGVHMCEDLITVCGDRTIMYGGCHNVCSAKTYMPPPCTEAPVSITAPSETSKKKQPPRGHCTHAKAFMCAPAAW
ncbi:hypothetical protein CC78DRAFT_566915 [Lojkania enalia]|uniref:Uncharacterized protein n=1 Tax=Lojkania enalia TaxID=147567 RepID=A0A9P4KE84_9PLEO|nr:hypothetical protein CC78DRAFT_566915 [Didymosphaeria enalia]